VTITDLLIILLMVVSLVLIAVFLGGWLVFRSKAQPGESMILQPKGQVFTIPDADTAESFPEDEVQKRSAEFLTRLMGDKP
jgi:Tfp pilus assembly protein PilN